MLSLFFSFTKRVSFVVISSDFLSEFSPFVANVVPYSKPVKINPNKETIQIPKSVNEAAFPSFFTLLESILNPNIKSNKNGIPINNNANVISNQIGITAS